MTPIPSVDSPLHCTARASGSASRRAKRAGRRRPQPEGHGVDQGRGQALANFSSSPPTRPTFHLRDQSSPTSRASCSSSEGPPSWLPGASLLPLPLTPSSLSSPSMPEELPPAAPSSGVPAVRPLWKPEGQGSSEEAADLVVGVESKDFDGLLAMSACKPKTSSSASLLLSSSGTRQPATWSRRRHQMWLHRSSHATNTR
mmetsp:Transcript_166909/g.535794  ORF Transcript_166909/g.535794 Transcript_166909/m.535794 type:complete len:200 (+) Transcript_166909:187-786(+)